MAQCAPADAHSYLQFRDIKQLMCMYIYIYIYCILLYHIYHVKYHIIYNIFLCILYIHSKSFEVGICTNLSFQYSIWSITRFRQGTNPGKSRSAWCANVALKPPCRSWSVGISLDLKPSAEVKAGPRIHSSKLAASTETEQSKNFLEAIPQWHSASFCFCYRVLAML